MPGKKASIIAPTLPPGALPRQSSLETGLQRSDTDNSDISFKQWHQRMQARHVSQGVVGFGLWKWCYRGCKICRWFDSIEYDVKLCKCCFKFKTFKVVGTIVLMAIFIYVFLYSILNDQLLPGGTIFFVFLMFLCAYLTGFCLLFIGFPPMFGHILVGMLLSNLPKSWLPYYDPDYLEKIGGFVEKILLLIAIVRAGLLLDISRIKSRLAFILKLSLIPPICEKLMVLVASHYLLELPWEWSALQGSLLGIVSLATVTSIMEQNRGFGFGEDKHLSTVLIAAAAINVIFGTFAYITCLSYIFPSKWKNHIGNSFWQIFVNALEQILLGLIAGAICGLLIAFFPDKRNKDAATLRIFIIGLGAFSVASLCYSYNLVAAGVLSVLIMCVIASNMWEELGWHDKNNPVQYFYTMAYYFGQPAALSLVGFSMNFQSSDQIQIGMAAVVIVLGLVVKEVACFLSTLGKLYPTTLKEKVFICVAWFSEGTFQALLVFAAQYMIEQTGDVNDDTFSRNLKYAEMVKKTTVLAILITTPITCIALALSSPALLTKIRESRSNRPEIEEEVLQSNAETLNGNREPSPPPVEPLPPPPSSSD